MSTISYRGRQAVLATKHHKEKAIRRPLRAAVGLDVVVPPGLDTDLLGTFSGEVEREGAPGEVVVRKARMGMAETGYRLGIASEGSFRPHAELAFETGSHELLAFVDDDAGVAIVEDLFTVDTNFGNAKVRAFDELEGFLLRVGFPAHALIAAPNDRIKVGHDNRVRLVLDDVPEQQLFKGIGDRDELARVVARCAALSGDGIVHVETDMRAHLNPTRMRNIRRLAFRLARRLATPCPSCAAPGWGAVEVRRGAPCTDCGTFNPEALAETLGCVHCGHREDEPRLSGQPCLACRHVGDT
jgi:hypothetical protein